MNGLPLPLEGAKVVLTSGYDAGTEMNTEDYADLVPPCQGLFGVSSEKMGTGETNPALAGNVNRDRLTLQVALIISATFILGYCNRSQRRILSYS